MSLMDKARARARNAIDAGSILGGLFRYYAKGIASQSARKSILRLHCVTNGKTTDRLASVLRMVRPPRQPNVVSGFAGDLAVEKQREIVGAIARDGYHVFEQRLPEEVCAELERFARVTPAIVEGQSQQERKLFNASAPLSKKYYFDESVLVSNHAMQQLMADPSLLAIAEMYLGTHPVLSDVTLWWSAVHEGAGGADAGQYYHFDFDPPPRWLMLFVYLTDVGPNNGPHVYVRGSQVSDQEENGKLRSRGYVRVPDNEILAAFGSDKIVELHGKRGTMLAVDTMGYHRGMPLVSGYRLMCQLIYGFAHFSGAQSSRVPVPEGAHPNLTKGFAAAPRVYRKYA